MNTCCVIFLLLLQTAVEILTPVTGREYNVLLNGARFLIDEKYSSEIVKIEAPESKGKSRNTTYLYIDLWIVWNTRRDTWKLVYKLQTDMGQSCSRSADADDGTINVSKYQFE